MGRFGNIVFTDGVKAEQERAGSRRAYVRADEQTTPDRLTADEAAFLAERDSFYMASVGETGWPYVQHRGGPKGFVRVLDERTIAFADYRGNRQYVSVGNLKADDRVALIFVDYPNRARLKVLARARLVEAPNDGGILAKLATPGYDAKVERAFVLTVEGYDWNCPQHITPRFSEAEVREAAAPLLAKIEALEAEVARLRASSP